MKKKVLIMVVLTIAIMGCSKSGKRNKKNKNQKTGVTATTSKKEFDALNISYEAYMMQRMGDTRRDALPEDVDGQMIEAWKSEIAKLYNLLLGELSDKEREKLRLDQKEWEKRVNTESKGKKLEETEKRAIEMAKRYDRTRKK